jgi:hypothetical protein
MFSAGGDTHHHLVDHFREQVLSSLEYHLLVESEPGSSASLEPAASIGDINPPAKKHKSGLTPEQQKLICTNHIVVIQACLGRGSDHELNRESHTNCIRRVAKLMPVLLKLSQNNFSDEEGQSFEELLMLVGGMFEAAGCSIIRQELQREGFHFMPAIHQGLIDYEHPRVVEAAVSVQLWVLDVH